MRGLLKERNIPLNETSTPIIPIMTYEDIRTFILCKELLNEGVYVNPVISCSSPRVQHDQNKLYGDTHPELMDEAADIIAKVFARI